MEKIQIIFEKLIEAIIILLSVFILGVFIPFLIASLVVLSTDTTYCQIIGGGALFWVFSVIGWIISAVYINEMVTEDNG